MATYSMRSFDRRLDWLSYRQDGQEGDGMRNRWYIEIERTFGDETSIDEYSGIRHDTYDEALDEYREASAIFPASTYITNEIVDDDINIVHKIVTDHNADTTTFILQTTPDNEYWYWEVSNQDIREYFKKDRVYTLAIALNGHITPIAAKVFCNDIDNADKGTSVAGFKTIDEALKDIGII